MRPFQYYVNDRPDTDWNTAAWQQSLVIVLKVFHRH